MFAKYYLVLWGEVLCQCTTSGSHFRLVHCVKDLFTLAAHFHQVGSFKNAQVMRYRRLRNVQRINDFTHAEPLAAAEAHDFLAGPISQGFGKKYRVNQWIGHIDNRL